jgi:hypothetical protein
MHSERHSSSAAFWWSDSLVLTLIAHASDDPVLPSVGKHEIDPHRNCRELLRPPAAGLRDVASDGDTSLHLSERIPVDVSTATVTCKGPVRLGLFRAGRAGPGYPFRVQSWRGWR